MNSYDAIINIRFLTTLEGGRKKPINNFKPLGYGCVMMIDGITQSGYDCRFVTASTFDPGHDYLIEIVFLDPLNSLSHLREGMTIHLWEGKIIANGTVHLLRRS